MMASGRFKWNHEYLVMNGWQKWLVRGSDEVDFISSGEGTPFVVMVVETGAIQMTFGAVAVMIALFSIF